MAKPRKGLIKLVEDMIDPSIQRLIDTGFLDSALKNPDPSFPMKKNVLDKARKNYVEARKNNPYFDEREKIAESNNFRTNFVETDLNRNIITPEQLKIGDILMPIMGDKTLHGKADMIGGVPTNVKGEAGADFPYTTQIGNASGWRGNIGGISPLHARAGLLRQITGRDPLAVYVNMGDEATNFTTPIVQNLIQEMKDRPITSSMAKMFDEAVRRYYKGSKGNPPFVGINHPDFEDQVMGINGYANIGEIRKAIYQAMKLKPLRDAGFPNPDQVIAAVNDPRLAGPELYRAGRSMFRVDPDHPVVYNRDNSGYTHQLAAKPGEEASFDTSYSTEEVFRDPFAITSKRKTGQNNPDIKNPPRPLTTNEARKAIIINTTDKDMYQKVDQQLIDELMTIREKNPNRRMFAGSGLIGLEGLENAKQLPLSELPKGVMDFATDVAEGFGISLLDSIRMIGKYAKFLPGMANMSSIPEIKPSKDPDKEFGRMTGGILATF